MEAPTNGNALPGDGTTWRSRATSCGRRNALPGEGTPCGREHGLAVNQSCPSFKVDEKAVA